MTASEKLAKLIEDDKLTEGQKENLNDQSIIDVATLENFLAYKIYKLRNETGNSNFRKAIVTLNYLFDYDERAYVVYDDYAVYDKDRVQELDFDTLNDALDID